MQLKDKMLDAIKQEIELQGDYLQGERIASVYFGGGTPSMLSSADISDILQKVRGHHSINTDAEITLEANPDDLSREKIIEFKDAGINRLSIGIQSFYDPHLTYMNRAHNATEASQCVGWAVDAGINNLSIDLIYGVPADDHEIWKRDLDMAMSLPVTHISAYCLTIEPDTAFGRWVAQEKMSEADEEFTAGQFEILLDTMSAHGFEQYEISSFCKEGQYSRHNSAYWQQKKYLGIGPSAHSFNGETRQFNITSNPKYIKSLEQGKIPSTVEVLSAIQVANEYLLTSIRTIWGSDLPQLEAAYPGWKAHFMPTIEDLLERNLVFIDQGVLKLTQHGKLVADEISLQLFMDE